MSKRVQFHKCDCATVYAYTMCSCLVLHNQNETEWTKIALFTQIMTIIVITVILICLVMLLCMDSITMRNLPKWKCMYRICALSKHSNLPLPPQYTKSAQEREREGNGRIFVDIWITRNETSHSPSASVNFFIFLSDRYAYRNVFFFWHVRHIWELWTSNCERYIECVTKDKRTYNVITENMPFAALFLPRFKQYRSNFWSTFTLLRRASWSPFPYSVGIDYRTIIQFSFSNCWRVTRKESRLL